MQSAHQTVRSLASSIRSSTLSILFRISACRRARAAARRGPWEAEGGSGGIESDAESPTPKGSAIAGEEGRAGRCRRRLVSTAIFISGIILPFLGFSLKICIKTCPGSNRTSLCLLL